MARPALGSGSLWRLVRPSPRPQIAAAWYRRDRIDHAGQVLDGSPRAVRQFVQVVMCVIERIIDARPQALDQLRIGDEAAGSFLQDRNQLRSLVAVARRQAIRIGGVLGDKAVWPPRSG